MFVSSVSVDNVLVTYTKPRLKTIERTTFWAGARCSPFIMGSGSMTMMRSVAILPAALM